MPKAKPYTGAVDPKVAAQLLNSTGQTVDGALLGDALENAVHELRQLVEKANESLRGSEFAPIVAEHLANKMGRRGHARLYVAETGSVLLDISYEEFAKAPKTRPQRTSKVPLMEDLKARAAKLGVDISEFGIKRKKIHEYLEKVESGEVTGAKKAKGSKSKKTEIRVADDPSEEDPGPMSAGPDETKVSPLPDDPKPPKKGFVKTSQAVSSPVVVDMPVPETPDPDPPPASKSSKSKGKGDNRRSMRELVQDAATVDIQDLLTSDPPE